jgi:hypothetical protein
MFVVQTHYFPDNMTCRIQLHFRIFEASFVYEKLKQISFNSDIPGSHGDSYWSTRLLRSWVRIPPGAWIFVASVVCCQVEVSATS